MTVREQAQADDALVDVGKWTGRILVPGELKRIPELLQDGEVPLKAVAALVPGPSVGILIATNLRLLWVDKGIISLREDTLDYSRISSVEMKTGLLGGEIVVNMYDHGRRFAFIWNRHVFPMGQLVRRITAEISTQMSATALDAFRQSPERETPLSPGESTGRDPAEEREVEDTPRSS